MISSENNICQLKGMFEIENNVIVIIITLSLFVIMPNYISKCLYKLWAPMMAPVIASVSHLYCKNTKYCNYSTTALGLRG